MVRPERCAPHGGIRAGTPARPEPGLLVPPLRSAQGDRQAVGRTLQRLRALPYGSAGRNRQQMTLRIVPPPSIEAPVIRPSARVSKVALMLDDDPRQIRRML